MQSRRLVAGPDRRVPTLRRHSLRSGRATRASTGTRRPTSSRGQPPVDVPQQSAPRGPEHRHGRYGVHIWSAKRHYGADPAEATWRPLTAITLPHTLRRRDDPAWLPLVTHRPTRNIRRPPGAERRCGDRTLSRLADDQTFTLTTAGLPSQTYTAVSQARSDGNNARIWGGMHYPSTVRSATRPAQRSPSTSTRTRCSRSETKTDRRRRSARCLSATAGLCRGFASAQPQLRDPAKRRAFTRRPAKRRPDSRRAIGMQGRIDRSLSRKSFGSTVPPAGVEPARTD